MIIYENEPLSSSVRPRGIIYKRIIQLSLIRYFGEKVVSDGAKQNTPGSEFDAVE